MKSLPRLALVSVSLIVLSACDKKPAAAPAPAPAPQATAAVESPTPGATPEAPAETAQAPAQPEGDGGRRQGGGDSVERVKQRLAEMQTSLGLTADQMAQVAAIFESQRPALEALRDDQSLSREQRREKMMDIRKTAEPQFTAILTPEQMTKWEAERKQRMERMGDRQGGKNRSDATPSPTN